MNIFRWFAFFHHGLVCMWRVSTGRWYVFRDRPYWFVQECARQNIDEVDPEEYYEAIRLVREARSELKRRHDRGEFK